MANVITYESGMAELLGSLKSYIAYTSKSVEGAIAHTAQGVVLGRGGNGFGKRREGLYGLTRALAFPSRDKIDQMFATRKFAIKRRYTAPGSPLSAGAYGSKSLLSGSAQAGPKMYRSADQMKYRAQTRAMLAKNILISNAGDKKSTSSFTYVSKNPSINYSITESMKRFKASRYLSIGWLPAVRVWKKTGGINLKTETLKDNASKYGSITFDGSGVNFSVTIRNNIPGFLAAEKKHGIIGRALSNVAADINDYLRKKFSMHRSKYISGNPISA
jgi:hypothetical protein